MTCSGAVSHDGCGVKSPALVTDWATTSAVVWVWLKNQIRGNGIGTSKGLTKRRPASTFAITLLAAFLLIFFCSAQAAYTKLGSAA